jgi:hypothetical protein
MVAGRSNASKLLKIATVPDMYASPLVTLKKKNAAAEAAALSCNR